MTVLTNSTPNSVTASDVSRNGHALIAGHGAWVERASSRACQKPST
ncbi:MAG: hypothetical protein IPG03_14435 [Candidatus Microthrix sp.]|nr:hypothetical protein [Candidatus Microthrix sp.]MBK6503495.1 hypothetical protein [Candidatus Microthrix sp.]